MDTRMDNFIHLIAIDFGTAGCGIAFATSDKPQDITVYTEWPGNMNTDKIPTMLLVNPEGECEAFGGTALRLYNTYASTKPNFDNYYLFRFFKMELYNQVDYTDLQIKALNGKCMPAVTVFSLSLMYLKNTIVERLHKTYKYPNEKFLWILTVPAIWNYGARQLMRQAADKVFDDTMIALEPEAAAVHYIQGAVLPKQAKSYLVVDCGGGTVDIVVHKMLKKEDGDISIVELAPPQGSSSGSFEVNKQFENLLCKLFNLSPESVQEVKKKFSKQWDKMIYDEFETSKQNTNPKNPHIHGVIEINEKLKKYFEKKLENEMKVIVANYKDHQIDWNDEDDTLILPYTTMYSLFQPAISRITFLIKEVLQKPECAEVDEIVLVGGFAINELLYQQIKSSFPSKKLEFRVDACVAVLKGAIEYGVNTKQIKSRKMPFSIGIETCVPFVDRVHDKQKKVIIKGKEYCQNVFYKCIGINESIEQSKVFEQVFHPQEDTDHCSFVIYKTSLETDSTIYVTDKECCYTVAHVVISNLNYLPQKVVKISLNCSGTEMKVSACSAVNENITLPVNFVDKAKVNQGLVVIDLRQS